MNEKIQKIEIWITDNPDMFISKKENRYNRKKLQGTGYYKTLTQRIISEGQLTPIKVNVNMEIIDGETRLSILKSLGEDIKYEIININTEQSLDLMLETSITTRTWKSVDILNHWSIRGKEPYTKILNILERNNMSIANIDMLNNGIQRSKGISIGSNRFNYGQMAGINYKHLEESVKTICIVTDSNKWNSSRLIINVFKFLLKKYGPIKTRIIFEKVAKNSIVKKTRIYKDETLLCFHKYSGKTNAERISIPAEVANG